MCFFRHMLFSGKREYDTMENTMKTRKIFLVGDSTVQTYITKEAPQCGWGAMLYRYFDEKNVKIYHSVLSEFDNSTTTCFDGIKKDGTCLRSCPMKYYTYTGRHFDHVNQMLKLFGGNDNETDT